MLIFTAIFVSGFAVSWGPVCWIYAAEIFPLNVRARAMSFTTGINWFTAMLMSYMLELIAPLGIHGVFYLFSGLCFLAVVFLYFFCPETRGVLLEDIEAVFDNFQVKNRRIVKILRRTCQRNIIKTYMWCMTIRMNHVLIKKSLLLYINGSVFLFLRLKGRSYGEK